MKLQESDLGAVVRSLRSLYGVSQQGLAKSVGLNKTSLCRIETGDRPITALEIAEICNYFNFSPDDFYKMADSRVQWLNRKKRS